MSRWGGRKTPQATSNKTEVYTSSWGRANGGPAPPPLLPTPPAGGPGRRGLRGAARHVRGRRGAGPSREARRRGAPAPRLLLLSLLCLLLLGNGRLGGPWAKCMFSKKHCSRLNPKSCILRHYLNTWSTTCHNKPRQLHECGGTKDTGDRTWDLLHQRVDPHQLSCTCNFPLVLFLFPLLFCLLSFYGYFDPGFGICKVQNKVSI